MNLEKINPIVKKSEEIENEIIQIKNNLDSYSLAQLKLAKKTIINYLNRNKKIRRELYRTKIKYDEILMNHKNITESIPLLLIKKRTLEEELITYNAELSVSLENDLLPKSIKEVFLQIKIILANEYSKFADVSQSIISPLMEEEFMGRKTIAEYHRLFKEYKDDCARLALAKPSIVGLYYTLPAKLTTNDSAFLSVNPEVRDALPLLLKDINTKIKNFK